MNIDTFIKNNYEHIEVIFKTVKKTGSRSFVSFVDLNNFTINPVNSFDHMNWLSSKFKWVKEEIDSIENHIGDERYDFDSSLEPDEHPGWHRFDIWEVDYRIERYADIMSKVSSQNHIYRTGFFRTTMEVGPAPNIQVEHKKFFRNLATTLNFNLKLVE